MVKYWWRVPAKSPAPSWGESMAQISTWNTVAYESRQDDISALKPRQYTPVPEPDYNPSVNQQLPALSSFSLLVVTLALFIKSLWFFWFEVVFCVSLKMSMFRDVIKKRCHKKLAGNKRFFNLVCVKYCVRTYFSVANSVSIKTIFSCINKLICAYCLAHITFLNDVSDIFLIFDHLFKR